MSEDNKTKTLVTVPEAAIMYPDLFNAKIDETGKILNRSTAYDRANRLPDYVKVNVGRSLFLRVLRMKELVEGVETVNTQEAA